MSRAMHLALDESQARAACETANVGISAIEPLPQGGVRLVCMSVNGAETIRRKHKASLIEGEVLRARHRPRKPLW